MSEFESEPKPKPKPAPERKKKESDTPATKSSGGLVFGPDEPERESHTPDMEHNEPRESEAKESTGLAFDDSLNDDLNEAKLHVRELYSRAVSLSQLDFTPDSPEELIQRVERGFKKVRHGRRPEAVANILRVIAGALDDAQAEGEMKLHKHNVDAGLNKVCPVYPFD